MAENQGKTAPAAKPRRHLRNFLLDRRFQFKYSLLLSGASAVLMATMGALLYVRMQDSERRLEDEAAIAHRGINDVADQAALMLRREMEISAQQLINRQLPCVAPPTCPPCTTETTTNSVTGVVSQGSGAACDVEMCKPLCEALGMRPAGEPAAPEAPPPAPAEAAPAGQPPAGEPPTTAPEPTAAATPTDPAAPPAAVPEQDRPLEPVAAELSADEQQRQRDRIRKIEETVRAETDQRAQEMEADTRARLAALDQDTQKRLEDLREANHRDLRFILVALIVIFLVLVAVGIVVTHKVVGPIYRMKMLVGKIDGDHLLLQGKLRKGDELQDLFEEVQHMLDRLREHQQAETTTLGELLARLGAAPEAERGKVLDDLEQFRARMAAVLDRK
jgi:CHASE3 domain sensor protein